MKTMATEYQDFPDLIQTCNETNEDTSDAMMCAYCGIENDDFKDFVHAFCETGVDPGTLCTDVRLSESVLFPSHQFANEREVKWITGKNITFGSNYDQFFSH